MPSLACRQSLFIALMLSATVIAQGPLGLVPLHQVTHTVAVDGDWSAAATWASGQVPTAGANVYVPADRTVRFDVDQTPPLHSVRIDGQLHFARFVDTVMSVDTVVVAMTGELRIGTPDQPVRASARLRFVDNGPLDPVADPSLVGRGLIVMGRFVTGGLRRSAYERLAVAPIQGATSLELAREPDGWRVGDQIVIAGTRYLGWQWNGPGVPQSYLGTEDEIRTIVAIDGTNVTVAPLQFDHPAGPASDLLGHVANLTRDIRIESEGGAAVPTQQRPHVMFMHTLDIDVNDVGFYDLGRTDKSIPVDDVGTNMNGQPGGGTNPRGRYSCHFHLGGADDALGQPASVRGCAVQGSPGWGIVSHDAYVVVEDCASYDVLGAHYVTEEGQELGAFRHCIAIKSKGGGPDDGRFVKEDTALHDFGHQGHGFWLQGRNVICEDNVAYGTTSGAFFWFHRSDVITPTLARANLLLPFDYMRMREQMPYNDVPIAVARRLEAVACSKAFWVIKANGWQNHDVRSMFADLLAWRVDSGMTLEYTRHYTLTRLRFYGNSPTNQWRTGLTFGTLVRDQVVVDSHIESFGNGMSFATTFQGMPDAPDVTLVDQTFANVGVAQYVNWNPQRQREMSSSQVVVGQQGFVPSSNLQFVLPTTLAWNSGFTLEGRKRDSLGSWEFGEDGFYSGTDLRRLVEGGYYVRPDGSKYVRIVELLSDRLTGELFEYPFELDIVTNYSYLGPNLGSPPLNQNTLPDPGAPLAFEVPASGRLSVPAPGLLAAAFDADGDAMTVLLPEVEQPGHGQLSVHPNGSFRYSCPSGYVGNDRIRFRITDARGRSRTAYALLQKVDRQVPAGFTTFGVGCAGTAGVPMLAAQPGSLPLLGSTFEMRIEPLPAPTAVAGILGFSDSQAGVVPLPLALGPVGMPQCTLYVSLDDLYLHPASTSSHTWTLPIPAGSSFAGARLFVQALIGDPPANAMGGVMTNAGTVTIGM